MYLQNYHVTKAGKTYRFVDPEFPDDMYIVSRPNGKIRCTCPDFKRAPIGTCDHIESLRELHQANGPVVRIGGGLGAGGWGLESESGSESGPPAPGPQPPAQNLPEIEKGPLSWWLELPFRADQIRIRRQDGMRYVDGASVIQRLNDVLGPEGWSFKLQGEPQHLTDEVIVRGQLEARLGNRWVVREDFGAHPYTRKKGSKEIHSRGDTVKAAVTDCIKRCAHQVGVGLHMYCDDDSYKSFRPVLKEAGGGRLEAGVFQGPVPVPSLQPADPSHQPVNGRLN